MTWVATQYVISFWFQEKAINLNDCIVAEQEKVAPHLVI